MVCVHLLSSSSICGGIWGISFCRIGIVTFSPLAIFSFMCVYVCAMVVGGVWWLMVCKCCVCKEVYSGDLCSLLRMVRHRGSMSSTICWSHICGVGPYVIMRA